MRPTLLKPGRKVKCSGHVMTFLRRDRQPCRPAVNWFQCDAYRGINGPDDDGRCTMSDYAVSRNVEPADSEIGAPKQGTL